MHEATLQHGHIRYLDSIEVVGIRKPDRKSDETLLLVHGFPLDHTMWQHQLVTLSEKFRLIVPDLAGFGQSRRLRPVTSMRGLAEELVELLDQLEIDRVNFCGLSMGGYIGWQFWRHHGNRVSRLIACNTRAAADNEAVARARRISADHVRAEGVTTLGEGMLGRLFARSNIVRLADEVQLIRDSMRKADQETVAQALEAMGTREDATGWVQDISVPTLFVAGADDEITPAQEMRENAEMVPGSEYVEIVSAGHLSPLENPEAFNAAILRFMGNND
jgi:pimeloyl-ACP methyl ester carboxylesterase